MTAALSSPVQTPPGLVFERVLLTSSTFDWHFVPGLHTVLGEATRGVRELFDLASGTAKPKRGRVLLDGEAPHASLKKRRSIASVGCSALPPMSSVREFVRAVAKSRGHADEPVFAQLEHWRIALPLESDPRTLDEGKRTALELALSLHHPTASLLLLWEPFTAPLEPSVIRAALEVCARDRPVLVFIGAPVVPPLPGALVTFGGGAAPMRSPSRPSRASLWLACNRVEDVARQFLLHGGVSGAEVLPGEPGLLRLRLETDQGAEDLCRAVLAFVQSEGLELRGLRFEVDP